MDTFILYENFISVDERTEIITWALTQKNNCIDRDNLITLGATGRRLSQEISKLTNVPTIIDNIFTKIVTTLSLQDATPLRYKLVMHEVGSDTGNHVDKYSNKFSLFFRAAVLVQEAKDGGIFRVNKIPVTMPERAMLNFVGPSTHEVTKVIQGERILLRANFYR